MTSPKKSELPAWLESLRTGEHPAVPASGPTNSYDPDTVDEGGVPGWMRNENADPLENPASTPNSARRSASIPAPHTDGEYVPPRGIAASSLIDEQALPSWMQENNPARQSPAKGISASSLVQPDALPDWMRSLQSSPGSMPPPGPPVPPVVDPITPVQPMATHNLIDSQALPSWLTGQNNNAPSRPVPASQPVQPPPMHQQPGLAASSLLDMNTLPGWLRENETSQGQPASPASSGPLLSAQPGQGLPPNTSGPLAAASLIDMNALPDWLRAPENPGMGPANTGNVGARYIAPQAPRAENIRVPSRPRGEMAPHEQSEVAANVFSSMLGVASTSPFFSSQPPSQGLGDSQGNLAGQPQAWQPQIPQSQGPIGYQGGYPAGNVPAWPQQQPGSGSNRMPTMPSQEQNGSPQASKPAKRGFLETIRSWFSR